MPSQNPATAGKKDHRPISAACSIAGTSRLQTDAAAMTPAAKPVKARCRRGFMPLFRKKTHPAPREVPRKGRSHSNNNVFVMSALSPPPAGFPYHTICFPVRKHPPPKKIEEKSRKHPGEYGILRGTLRNGED